MRFFPFAVFASVVVFSWAAIAEQSSSRSKADTDEDATPARAKKKATPKPQPRASDNDDATPKPKSTPSRHKVSDDDDADAKPKARSTPGFRKASDDDDEKPKPRGTPARKKSSDDEATDAKPKPGGESVHKKFTADGDAPAATPHPKPAKTEIDEKSDTVKKKEAEATPPLPDATPGGKGAPPASIESTELAKFSQQPEKVKQLIEAALSLSKQGLTYKYGSDDPANGGMDCSGSVSYLLRQQGFKDVPRDAAGQYIWARKNGQFFAVISKKAGGFEFSDLEPGDLMFWSGTYSVDRDPPVTHSMIYLGEHKTRKQQVMWGASDGRSYDGQSRYGVGVFDFKMPKTGGEGEGTTSVGNHPDFLGYARIPGLREAAEQKTAAAGKDDAADSDKPSTGEKHASSDKTATSQKAAPTPKASSDEPAATPKPATVRKRSAPRRD